MDNDKVITDKSNYDNLLSKSKELEELKLKNTTFIHIDYNRFFTRNHTNYGYYDILLELSEKEIPRIKEELSKFVENNKKFVKECKEESSKYQEREDSFIREQDKYFKIKGEAELVLTKTTKDLAKLPKWIKWWYNI